MNDQVSISKVAVNVMCRECGLLLTLDLATSISEAYVLFDLCML